MFSQVTQEQKLMDANRIKTPFINTSIFNQDISSNNSPGFEWPKGNVNGAHLIFTTGLTITANLNGTLLMAASSYKGECQPGYILNGVPMTDSRFHVYKIYWIDNGNTNPDYANWGDMVPYGAPFTDINTNGIFDPGIDKPGVTGSQETIFICMTDGFPGSHTASEGFGGGTAPLMAEMHLTAWSYTSSGLEDVNFIKWEIINKSGSNWNGAIFSIVSDYDVGDAVDDWVGCDTSLEMSYGYNGDNDDGGGGPGTYGSNPPAVGISFLKTPKNNIGQEFGLTSFVRYGSSTVITCEGFPNTPTDAYNYMKGLKRDGTQWLNPEHNPPTPTRYIFSGDPETSTGWTENKGVIRNCNGIFSDTIVSSNPGDRRICMSTGDSLFSVGSNQAITIVASQFAEHGSNYLNSVTKLKQLAGTVRNFWQTIGITPISSEVPIEFRLHQNYPNPFNPSTKIRFDVPGNKEFVKLIIYDISGREVAKLVNQELAPGVYEYDFDGTNLSSGMYIYKLEAGNYSETKKMVLIK
ncbi:MAG: T9SS type A sorting domain-containing protein [Ignavibacteriae bacterium]|nr:T9SS type A sorting domain-containing protein [Ignavibacteriota bacterium]MCB9244668.1 T9SS type A sorting domain-containing protein [Ignavibacteriales bacterium]